MVYYKNIQQIKDDVWSETVDVIDFLGILITAHFVVPMQRLVVTSNSFLKLLKKFFA